MKRFFLLFAVFLLVLAAVVSGAFDLPKGNSITFFGSSNGLWLEIQVTNTTGYFTMHPAPSDGQSPVFDLLMTTNLSLTAPGLNRTNWIWLFRTDPGQTNLTFTNLPPAQAWFLIARTNDADSDDISDALEHFVSHTDPAAPSGPVILSHPMSQRVNSGDTVNFSVFAQGAQPLSYQWTFKGANIVDATNALLSLESAGVRDRGAFTVVVTNSSGKTASAPAVLGVMTDWYMTPKDGRSNDDGDGSLTNAWDLWTALEDKSDKIQPGDTVWLENGVYHHSFLYGGSAAFNYTDGSGIIQPLPTILSPAVSGLPGAPITIRPVPGARATVDGCFVMSGTSPSYLRLQDLEIAMLTYTNRYTGVSTYDAWAYLSEDGTVDSDAGIDRSGINLGNNPGIEIINCIVHDCVNTGLGGGASLYYGCLIYNNGYYNADGTNSSISAKGCGFYIQNKDRNIFSLFKDTIVCDNAKTGFQANSQSGADIFNNIWVDGTTLYQNGHLAGLQANAQRDDNSGWDMEWAYQGGTNSPFINCGLVNMNLWNSGQPAANTHQSIDNSGAPAQNAFWFTNCIIACQHPTNQDGRLLRVNWNLPSTNVICRSNYFFGGDFSNIQSQFADNTFQSNCPVSGNKILVQPNQYEPGRANIIIYNWSLATSVQVDLSTSGLTNGESYELHQCQDYYGDVTDGLLSGSSLTIQMTNHSVAVPVGQNLHPAPTSFPQFGAFIIQKKQSMPR